MTVSETFSWTPEAIKTMRAMYLEKIPYEAIGQHLCCSRSAVSGKVSRMIKLGKLKRVHEKAPIDRARVKAMIAAKEPKMKAEPLPPSIPEPTPDTAVSLLKANGRQCRFPVSEIGAPVFMVCGAKADTQSYCAHHRAVSYTPATINRRA